MSLSNDFIKLALADVIEKTKKSIERELSYKKEQADDMAAFERVIARKEAGEPLPEDCGYTSYDEWIDTVEKELISSGNSLSRIQIEKCELVAFEFYIVNGPDDTPQE